MDVLLPFVGRSISLIQSLNLCLILCVEGILRQQAVQEGHRFAEN